VGTGAVPRPAGSSDARLRAFSHIQAWHGRCSRIRRILQCTESSLIGRDARELLRKDWRRDSRKYVARALVGVGDIEVTVPFVAPCGKQAWFKHELEPLVKDGLLERYRATIAPHPAAKAEAPRRWWERRAASVMRVWNVEVAEFAQAS